MKQLNDKGSGRRYKLAIEISSSISESDIHWKRWQQRELQRFLGTLSTVSTLWILLHDTKCGLVTTNVSSATM